MSELKTFLTSMTPRELLRAERLAQQIPPMSNRDRTTASYRHPIRNAPLERSGARSAIECGREVQDPRPGAAPREVRKIAKAPPHPCTAKGKRVPLLHRAEHYRQQAEESRLHAERSKHEEHKAAWLKLAAQWLKFAEEAEGAMAAQRAIKVEAVRVASPPPSRISIMFR
jgi:hypothetical protein